MQANAYFGGRAVVKSLLVTDQPANRPEVCARIQSPRGELAVLTDGSAPIRHLSYLELRPGMVRGNHFHKQRREFFYLISGELTLTLADVDSGEKAVVEMRAGDLLYVSPSIAHALRPSTGGHAVEYATEAFDAADVFPYPLA
jgi:oxalate decarboxylase/phosphoglucose isomerase-like protein (cupin superfamily)